MNRLFKLLFGTALASALLACQTTAVAPDNFAAAASTTNKRADLNTQLGIEYMNQGKYELAWKRLNMALEADPNYSTTYNTMGLLYTRLGEVDKAEEHFRRAIELNPTDSASQTNYGSFLCQQGRREEGEQRFLQALKNSLFKDPEITYVNAGMCVKGGGDLDKAEAYFRAALTRNPRMPNALLNMAEISMAKGRNLPARGYLQRYLEVGKHNARTLWLGIRIERLLGDKNVASSDALLLKANFPDSEETRRLLESEQL